MAPRRILNKLSVDNFHQLCGQLFALEIPSLDVLKGIVDIIFDKATLEPTFSSLYAQMCSDWVNKAPKFKEPGSERDMVRLHSMCQGLSWLLLNLGFIDIQACSFK
jgi:translation initiation factor 4G